MCRELPRAALLAALVLVAACGGQPSADAPDPVDEDGVPDDPLTGDVAGPDDAADDEAPRPDDDAPLDPHGPLTEAVDTAMTDAAAAAGADAAEVDLVDLEAVTWPDGALGCPSPGQAYTQALVDGYRIVLEVAGEQVVYHGAQDGEPFRCEDPQPPVGDR